MEVELLIKLLVDHCYSQTCVLSARLFDCVGSFLGYKWWKSEER